MIYVFKEMNIKRHLGGQAKLCYLPLTPLNIFDALMMK